MNLQRISKKVDMHADLSLRVKQFIHNQSINVYYPFDNNTDRNKNVMLSRKAKRSLPDWRRLYPSMTIEKKKLYQDNDPTIETPNPTSKSTFHVSHASNFIRSNKTFKDGEDNKMSTLGTFVSRKKTRLRQSLISFALVQNCYEHEVLHEQRAQTAKVKRYYETRNQVEKETCAKIISEIDHSNPYNPIRQTSVSKPKKVQVTIEPYNRAKISRKSIVKNSSFYRIDLTQEEKTKSSGKNGRRFYTRL